MASERIAFLSEKLYDPDQPRDEQGRWGEGGAGGAEGGEESGGGAKREGYGTRDIGGVRVLVKEGMDPRDQRLTPDDVRAAINQIPEQYRNQVPQIRVTDELMIDDEGVVGTTAAASMVHEAPPAGSRSNMDTANEIVLWAPAGDLGLEVSAGYIRHEVGHAIMPSGDFEEKWAAAAASDGESISDYAKTSTSEDFAETIRVYWSPDSAESRTVDRFFPARAALLKEYGIAGVR